MGGWSRAIFDEYPILRIGDTPQVNIHFGGPLSGHDRFFRTGRAAGRAPVGPAVGNAIFRAIGKRIRSTPIRKHESDLGLAARIQTGIRLAIVHFRRSVSGITQTWHFGIARERTLARRDDIRSVADQPEGGHVLRGKRRGGSLIARWKPGSTSLIPLNVYTEGRSEELTGELGSRQAGPTAHCN